MWRMRECIVVGWMGYRSEVSAMEKEIFLSHGIISIGNEWPLDWKDESI